MENNYTVPFGIDAGGFFQGVKDIDKASQDMEQNVNEANKSMRDGFVQTGKAADDLQRKLKADAEAATAVRNAAREMGKEIGNAAKAGDTKQLEALATKFQDTLAKIGKGSKINIDVDINDAKVRSLAGLVAGSTSEFETLTQIVANAKQQLANFAPGSEEFNELNQQIQLSEGLLEGLADAEKVAETGSKSLKAQLKELKADLAAMEIAGEGGTEKFVQMSVRAGELEDQIGDVSARVRVLASDTKYLDAGVQAITALAGGYAAAQGVVAIFGSENEALNESLKKVTAAMAILQGVQAIANALNKDSALNVLLFSRAQSAQVITTEAVTAATTTEVVATEAATVATEGFTTALLSNPFTAILVLLAAAAAALYQYVSASDSAKDSTKALNEELETQKEFLSLQEATIKRRTDLLVAQAKANGKTEEEITKIQSDGLRKRLSAQRENTAILENEYNKAIANKKISTEDFKKAEDAYLEAAAKQADTESEIEVKKYEAIAAANKKTKEDNTKATAEAKKSAEEKQKISEQVLKFTKYIQDQQLTTLKDGYAKEREQARIKAEQNIADIQKEVALSSEAEKLKSEAIKATKNALSAELDNIDKEEQKHRAELEIQAAQTFIDLRKESLQNELNALSLESAEKEAKIREDYKDDEKLQGELIDALGAYTAEKRKEVTLKYTQSDLQSQEDKEIAMIDLLTGFAEKPVAVEEEKQRAILQVRLKYAKQQLEALIASGKTENDTVVVQAKAQIKELQDTLGEVGQSRPVTMFSLLGFDDDLNEKQKRAITESLNGVLTATRQVTDGLIAEYQRQIDAREKNIEKYDEEISSLKDQLDEEQSLKDQGFASNTARIQQEIDVKEKQKEEEIRQRNEAFEEQKKIRRAQLTLDTVVQLSSLITASANIIEGFSTIPIVGLPLGLLAVGAMFAGFVTAKASAYKAINESKPQEFGEGGWIDGPSHEGGGVAYVSNKNSGVRVLEGKEFVVNKEDAEPAAPLLEAINNGNLWNMNEDDLRTMLAGMGIHLQGDEMEAGLRDMRTNEALKNSIEMNNNFSSKELESIDKNMAYLAEAEKNRIKTWEDSEFYYSQQGNKVTKERKIKK